MRRFAGQDPLLHEATMKIAHRFAGQDPLLHEAAMKIAHRFAGQDPLQQRTVGAGPDPR